MMVDKIARKFKENPAYLAIETSLDDLLTMVQLSKELCPLVDSERYSRDEVIGTFNNLHI